MTTPQVWTKQTTRATVTTMDTSPTDRTGRYLLGAALVFAVAAVMSALIAIISGWRAGAGFALVALAATLAAVTVDGVVLYRRRGR